jgi:hypothetical protein
VNDRWQGREASRPHPETLVLGHTRVDKAARRERPKIFAGHSEKRVKREMEKSKFHSCAKRTQRSLRRLQAECDALYTSAMSPARAVEFQRRGCSRSRSRTRSDISVF